jgi:V/A-type H+-transporting ATPase subunit D
MRELRRAAGTRQALLRERRRLDRVSRGVGLLRRKREALVAELFRIARPAADLRVAIGTQAERAWPPLLAALADEGSAGARVLGWPARQPAVELRAGSVWGVPVAEITRHEPLRRTPAARGVPAGTASLAATQAADAFEELGELLLEAANRETLLRRLGEAVARTSRQVHTLERRVTPGLESGIVRIRRALDEREREEHLRLARLLRRRP